MSSRCTLTASTEQAAHNHARLHDWRLRWYVVHGRLPDVCAHRRQLQRGLVAPPTQVQGRRALQVRIVGDPRC